MKVQRKKKYYLKILFSLIEIIIAFFIISKIVYQIIDTRFYEATVNHMIETLQIVEKMGIREVETNIKNAEIELKETARIYGNEIFNEPNKRKVLQKLPLPEHGIRYVFYGKDGENISSDGESGSYQKEEDILKAWEGEIVLSGPFFNERREYILSYIAPIYRGEEIVGLISLENTGYCLSEWISMIQFSTGGGAAYLIDEDGTNIATSREENREWIVTEYNSFALAAQNPNSQHTGVAQIEKLPLMGESGYGVYQWDGADSYVVYAPVESTGWGFFVGFYSEKLKGYIENIVRESIFKNQIIFLIILIIITIFIVGAFERLGREKQEKIEIIQTLAAMYNRMYTVDLEKDIYECIQSSIYMKERKENKNIFTKTYREFMELYVHPEDKKILSEIETTEKIKKIFTKEKPYIQMEYRIIDNGETIWEHRDVIVVSWREEKPMKVLMAIKNVSEQKLADERAGDTLRDALAVAKAANEAKCDFLSRMSHDIRTPMNAIIGMTTIAETHLKDSDRIKDCLKKISISSKHLLSLINEVLDMSKIESGKINLTEEEVNIPVLIENLISVIYPTIEAKSQILKVNIQEDIHESVIGDPLRMQQIFMNLISNAVKYTPSLGEIRITIRERKALYPNMSFYTFCFEDNGIGMEKEFLNHIFEPFTRAEDSRINKIEGTGLGMAIAQNIVHMMNGTIEIESEVGRGTKVTVEICLKLQEKEEGIVQELQNKRFLVVDDDSVVCESACIILKEIGMQGEWVLTGEEAIEKVIKAHREKKDYDVVMIDWKMPKKDGVQIVQELREQLGEKISIIIISSYDWSDIEVKAKEAGVDAFITKPLFKSKLILAMQSLEKEKQTEREQGKNIKQDFSGKRVLLVEDNELNMEIAAEILESFGLKIEIAYNGKEALDLFKKAPEGYFDLIFMDIQMPVMNGYEATEEIRKLNRKDAKEMAIIAMTANAFLEDIQHSKMAGMNEHITKPLDIEQLLKTLNQYLSK